MTEIDAKALAAARTAAHKSRSSQPHDIDGRWADEEAGEAAVLAYLATVTPKGEPAPAPSEPGEDEVEANVVAIFATVQPYLSPLASFVTVRETIRALLAASSARQGGTHKP